MKTTLQAVALMLLSTIPFTFIGQTVGPGGVGNSSSMGLWLDANEITNLNDGNEVTSWRDLSGNGNHAVTPDPGANTPEFNNSTNTINGYPVVYFDGNNTELKVPDSDELDGTSGLYLLAVAKVYQGPDDVRAIVGKRRTYGSNLDEYAYNLFYWTGNNLYLDVNSNDERFHTSTSYNYGITRIQGFEFDGSRAQNQRSHIIVNNAVVQTGSNDASTINNSPRDLIIGTMNHGYNKYTEMDLAELIIFQRALTDAEENIVNNALSAKYALSLDSEDLYDGDDASNGDFDHDVIGIGKEADGSHSSSAKAGLQITVNTGMDQNGDYLFGGHNSLSNSLIDNDPDMAAAGVDKRWERIWYFNKPDAATAMTNDLSFDFSDAGLNTTITGADVNSFKLLTRSGTGSWAVVAHAASSFSGDVVGFDNVNITDGNQYTLGLVDPDDNTFPVELIHFSAEQIGDAVKLYWSTASELNNDYFSIEHSQDGQVYSQIDLLDGNGNSNEIHKYSFVHEQPSDGFNYYRLKQVDFNGQYEYHGPVVVKAKTALDVDMYQNNGQLKIQFNKEANRMLVKIYSLDGRMIYNKYHSGSAMNIPITNLSNSIYIVNLITENEMIQKKIYLNE